MDRKLRFFIQALMLGIAGAFLVLAVMGNSGILPAAFPLMSS